ncbi:DMT family transporter [Marinobacterium sp. YM272]|uniref:DMT family transporter n=1 Tax=Marinobacterium sp. YM272 TaxID=3421654 RepID=UPI003D7FF9AD
MTAQLRAHLLLLLWTALVASSFPVAALFNAELSTNFLVSLRFIAAGVVMLVFMRDRTLPSPLALLIYSILGLLLASFFSIMFKALQYTTPLTLAALFVSQPLFAYLISMLIRIETLQWKRLGTLLLAALAALVIVSRADLERLAGFHLGFGETLFLGGCVLSACYNNLSRYASDRHLIPSRPYRTTCYSLLSGGVLIGIPDLLIGDLGSFFATLGLTDLSALGYLTLFTTLITFWVLQIATLRLPPSTVAAYGYMPPMLVLYAELILGTTAWVSGYLLATLMLISSMLLLSNSDRQAEKRAA